MASRGPYEVLADGDLLDAFRRPDHARSHARRIYDGRCDIEVIDRRDGSLVWSSVTDLGERSWWSGCADPNVDPDDDGDEDE
jgi:hypothetical protein